MLSIQKILEKKKENSKFVNKPLKLRFNHLFQMIGLQNKWQKKFRKMKAQNKRVKLLNKSNKLKLKQLLIKKEFSIT